MRVVSRAALLTLAVVATTGCGGAPSPSLRLPDSSSDQALASPGRSQPDRTPAATGVAELDRHPEDTDDLRARREALVTGPIASAVNDQRIIDAFRDVPRHAFVPTDLLDRAYFDSALPIEAGQTISQPSLVAMMTELVDITDGERVLEVGTGSGFQAAILGQLTDEVYSVEIIPELRAIAGEVLERLGHDHIRLDRRDGYLGWPEEAPFDAIVVTAAADHLPPPLVEQLSPDGGRMVIPIGPVGDVQTLWLVTRNGDEVGMQEVVPVLFVPLTREEQ